MPKKLTTLPPAVGSRLAKVRKSLGLTQQAFADLVGITQATLSAMERGQSPVSSEVLYGLAGHAPEVDLREILCGSPAPSRLDAVAVASLVRPVIRPVSDNLSDLPPDGVADAYVAVPLVDGQVAAGPGGVAWESVLSLVWVFKPELGRRKNLVALRVAGDSMAPTIPDQAIIIVDRDSRQPAGNRKGIWALRTEDGAVQIKRLQRYQPPQDAKQPETWWTFSDNFQDYPPTLVWTGDFEKLIIGQVVWMWRSLI